MELNLHSKWSLHKYIFVILFLAVPAFTYIEHSVAEDSGDSQQNCRAFDLSRRIPQRDQGRVGCGYATTQQQCQRVDLRDQRCPNGQRRIPEPRDQRATNFCFAHTLADVYSFISCRTYSALHTGVASNFQAWMSGRPGKGGYNGLNLGMKVEDADAYLRSFGGVCAEESFPSNRQEVANHTTMETYFQAIQNQRLEHPHMRCARVPVPEIRWGGSAEDVSQAQARSAIDQALGSGQPAMINYAGGILFRRRIPSRRPTHYSTVIAREWRNGRCQYLVRESSVVERSDWSFEPDGVWVDDTALIPSVSRVQFHDTSTGSVNPPSRSGRR